MEQTQEYRHIVRVANTDLNGAKAIYNAIRKIKGIDFMFSNAICTLAGVDPTIKAGDLTDAQVQKLDEVIKSPARHGVPSWILNRRKDPEDGTTKHLITGDLTFTTESDIRNMKKIKSYKGVRHSMGQPVRGQRTRSNFRKNKGKGPGVKRSAAAKASGGGKT